jgi:hypothetical protein
VAVSDDRDLAVVARQARRSGRVDVHLAVLRAGQLPLVLVEADVEVANDRWELRSSGLWIDAVEVVAGRQWSYGLEAFGLAIDEPDELLARGYGHRTPLGWELDFLADDRGRPAVALQAGRVDGVVLTGPGPDGELAFSGPARRLAWDGGGPAEPSAPAWGLAGLIDRPVEVALPARAGDGQAPSDRPDRPVWWVGHDGDSVSTRWTGRGPTGAGP